MQTPILLKNFTHSGLYPVAIASRLSAEENHQEENHTSSFVTNVDFENGIFTLEGDWYYMMSCNKNAEPAWFNYHSQKISIYATIFPSAVIDLSDYNNDGAIFILEGNIKDHATENLSPCAGLLILDKITENKKTNNGTWNICFYLYDNNNEECEIAYKLPVYVSGANNKLN